MTNPQNKAIKFSIRQIVKQGFFFEIPPYQRLYEWGEVQIVTLLEDVKKAQEESKDIYFIGNVVVSKKDDRYILIDGQQRLTTLFLIGVYLTLQGRRVWKKFIKLDERIRISMPLRENEEMWLSGVIDKGTEEGPNVNSEIHQKIIDGLKTIRTWFDQNFKDKDKQMKKKFAFFLYREVAFAIVELTEGTDLNQFFVRMNNRGKQLEKHEILKARLLKAIKDEDKQKYAKIWDLCSDMDKYIFQSASDRDFLKKNTDIQEGKALYKILMNGDPSDTNAGNESENKKDDDLEKVKSIIDFPTFLLHVAKLVKKTDGDISINKDKLLDIISLQITEESNGKKNILVLGVGVEKFISAMLKYRILFDYFVIKRMIDGRLSKQGEYVIKRFYENNSYTIAIGNSMKELAMIQNYLRVAREGDKQNYHHWLTPFLSFLNQKINIGVIQSNKQISIENFLEKGKFKDWVIQGQEDIYKEQEEIFVVFLRNLDKDLAFAQLGRQDNEGKNLELLEIANRWTKKDFPIKWEKCSRNNIKNLIKTLNSGVGTPHYWFYRLEYYLMQEEKFCNKKIEGVCFGNVVKEYRFRYVDSIEHIQPQSKKDRWGNVDIFGNLALISKDFNSSLNNQEVGDKYQDIVKRVNNGNIQSLKMFLAYASMKNDDGSITWTLEKAQNHQTEMLKVLAESLELDINNISKISKQDT